MSKINTPRPVLASARRTLPSKVVNHDADTVAVSHHPVSRTSSNFRRSPSKNSDQRNSLQVANTSAVSVSFAADPTSNIVLGDREYRALSLALAQKPNVVSLSLQGNILSNSAVITLCGELGSTTSRITSLNLSMCGLGNDKAARIVAAAVSNVYNRRPTVSSNGSPLAVPAGGLQVLDLSLNHITEAGALAIAKELNEAALGADLNNAQQVRVHDSHRFSRSPSAVSSRSVTTLSQRAHPLQLSAPFRGLHTLVLRFNRLTVKSLQELLRATSDLDTLDARYCALNVNENSFPQLLQAISESNSISRLLIDGNGITDAQNDSIERQLALVTTGALRFDGITATLLVGPLPQLDQYIRSRRPQDGLLYPPEVVEEAKRLVGESLLVRGELRDICAGPTGDRSSSRAPSASRSSSSHRYITKAAAARLEGVEVSATTATRCEESFQVLPTSRRTYVGASGMSVSRRGLQMQGDAEQPRCAPCPNVNQKRLKESLGLNSSRSGSPTSTSMAQTRRDDDLAQPEPSLSLGGPKTSRIIRASRRQARDTPRTYAAEDEYRRDEDELPAPTYLPPQTEVEVTHDYHKVF